MLIWRARVPARGSREPHSSALRRRRVGARDGEADWDGMKASGRLKSAPRTLARSYFVMYGVVMRVS